MDNASIKREIKFRAWIIAEKRIVPIESIDFEFRVVRTGSGVYDFGQVKLIQYTGLKDKNGKEIYEGDIIKRSISLGLVEFKKGAFGYTAKTKYDNNFYSFCFPDGNSGESKDWVVIGNIYENPELLEVDNEQK